MNFSKIPLSKFKQFLQRGEISFYICAWVNRYNKYYIEMAQYFHLINLSFVRRRKIKVIYIPVKDEIQSNSSLEKKRVNIFLVSKINNNTASLLMLCWHMCQCKKLQLRYTTKMCFKLSIKIQVCISNDSKVYFSNPLKRNWKRMQWLRVLMMSKINFWLLKNSISHKTL